MGRDCFADCVRAIQPQVDQIFAIWAPRSREDADWEIPPLLADLVVASVPSWEQRNISRWWNIGIDAAKKAALQLGITSCGHIYVDRWDVAILNDDAIVPDDWFDRVSTQMRNMKVAAGSMGTVPMPVLHTRPGVTRLDQRMSGFAFMLAGELGVRADETMQWWCGDNDIDMQSRLKGGTVVIPDTGVKHLFPNGTTTGRLAERTAFDMQRFVEKWGFRPWNL
jgi:hypothetical protein